MPILFQACLELFIAWSESLFTEDKYQMGIYDVVSRFAMCFFLIFLFIWSHFVVFQLLLLPFVLFHIRFEYPLCSIMQSVQVVYLPHCYSLEPSIQVCLFVLSGFSLDSVCVIFTLTFSLIVWFCVFELFLFCFVFVFFVFLPFSSNCLTVNLCLALAVFTLALPDPRVLYISTSPLLTSCILKKPHGYLNVKFGTAVTEVVTITRNLS